MPGTTSHSCKNGHRRGVLWVEARGGMLRDRTALTVVSSVLLLCLGAVIPATAAAGGGLTIEDARRIRSVWWVALSPDGQSVAYVLGGKEIWVAPAGGGPGRALPWDGGWVGQLAWLPDGTGVSFLARDLRGVCRVWSLPLRSGGAFAVTSRDSEVTEFAWSPTGSRLAYVTDESTRERSPLSLAGSAGAPIDMAFDGADLRDVLLLFSKLSGLSFVLDPDVRGTVHAQFRQKPWDQAFEVLLESHDLGYTLHKGVVRVGRRVGVSEEDAAPPSRGKPIVIDKASFKEEGEGYLPPDGKRQLAIRDTVTREVSTVLYTPRSAEGLAWSPDGRRLAFAGFGATGRSGGSWDVFVVGWDGMNLRAVVSSPHNEDSPSFSPDGTEIVYRVEAFPADSPSRTHRLAAVNVASGRSRALFWVLDREIEEPRVAPDSRHAWFLLPDNGTVQLARANLDDGQVEIVVGGEQEVREFAVGTGGRVAFVSSTMNRPAAVFAVTTTGAVRPVADPNAGVARRLGLLPARRLVARAVAGPPVEAFFLAPRGTAVGGAPPPAVVWLHGGPYAQHTASFNPLLHLLSDAGIAVLLPNPRGSSGRGRAFGTAIQRAWGTVDYDDVMALVDEAVRQGLVDGKRLGVGGWSYGGFLTNHILTRTERFKAAVSGGSLSNMLALYGVSDASGFAEEEMGLPWTMAAKYVDRSPLFRVDRVRTPTLVLCGQDDMRTPLSQSEQWYYALKRVGVEAQLVIYPGEGHSFGTGPRLDVMERSLAWYSRLLRPDVQPRATHGATVGAAAKGSAGGGR